jgi:hypothetical protein
VFDLLQLLGATAILAAFIATQRRWLAPLEYASLTLNLAGSGLLACLALIGHQWGFLLLEGGWALVSAGGLWSRRVRGHPEHRLDFQPPTEAAPRATGGY